MDFLKLSGAGNDFIAFDNREGALPNEEDRPAWFARLCARGSGVGADGVLVLEHCDEANVRMRYHNADGYETEMCGNGLRCLARFAYHHGAIGKHGTVLTGAGVSTAEIVDDENVRVSINDPKDLRSSVALNHAGKSYDATVIRVGVPHVAIPLEGIVGDLASVDVFNVGRALRSHPEVMPDGANINFFVREAESTLRMRTYERGVENETLACGTGAVACSIAAALRLGVASPVTVITQSGLRLGVRFKRDGNAFTDVELEGPAIIVYEGQLTPPMYP